MSAERPSLLPPRAVVELLSGVLEYDGTAYKPSLDFPEGGANGGCLWGCEDSDPTSLTEGWYGILNHTLLVRRVALFLGEQLNEKLGYEAADLELLSLATFFEDFAKRYEKQHTQLNYDHGIWAAAILADSPQIPRRNEIIELVETHMYIYNEHLRHPQRSWNEIIVYLSDTHAHQQIVSIEDRIHEVTIRNAGNQAALDMNHSGMHIALELEEEYFKALGLNTQPQKKAFIEKLVSLPEREDEKILRTLFATPYPQKEAALEEYELLLQIK